LHNAKTLASADLCALREDLGRSVLQSASMANSERERDQNNLRAWREFRRLTQEQLAVAIDPPTTGAVISLLESGDRQLSPKWLRKLAPALGTTPGYLLDYTPDDINAAYLEAALSVPQHDRPQVLQILKTFKRAG
jgi:transcriptional regulator with XRE-family HTH domain